MTTVSLAPDEHRDRSDSRRLRERHAADRESARRAWRASLASGAPISGAELGRQFRKSDRWGRARVEEARAAFATAARHPVDPSGAATDWPADGDNVGDQRRPESASVARGSRWSAGRVADVVLAVLVGMFTTIVVLAPLALSANDLAAYARERLGLTGTWVWLPAMALDAAAAAAVLLTFHASLRGESAGAARLLVWVLAGASAWANYRQGITVSTDSAVFHGGMPLLAATMLDLDLRYVRRNYLAHLGALEQPLPRYRAWRWALAPGETFGAWRTAVTDNITDPETAVTAYRSRALEDRAG